ncbi:MAG: radical SAM family heme chaperone HemW [Thermoanaerobaculia bacterium]|nr:radical SAM family heme chaperone HemW [Thermoanaerobaculia bacterium]
MSRALGLYLHVPFCRTRCRYCDFYRVGENRPRMDRFLEALAVEIDGWREHHGRRVATVFLGGGTPSLLAAAEVAAVLDRLAGRFAFTADVEITAEANPSDLAAASLRALRAAGVNRLSLGVQSFVDRELTLLGRRHDAARAARGLGEARAAGFDNLSLDLMVGIPGQTDGSFAASLERAVELAPDHVSLYLLEVHAGSEIDFLRRERPRLFAGEEALRRRYLRLRERLAAAGYRQYEISNFARPGRECKHNLGYWRCEEWLGLGPAAHSHVGGRRFRHLPDLDAWIADPLAVEELPIEPAAERVFLGLRLAEGIEDAWLADAGLDAAEIDRRLAKLSPFLAREAGRVRLNADGYLVSNAVLAELLR